MNQMKSDSWACVPSRGSSEARAVVPVYHAAPAPYRLPPASDTPAWPCGPCLRGERPQCTWPCGRGRGGHPEGSSVAVLAGCPAEPAGGPYATLNAAPSTVCGPPDAPCSGGRQVRSPRTPGSRPSSAPTWARSPTAVPPGAGRPLYLRFFHDQHFRKVKSNSSGEGWQEKTSRVGGGGEGGSGSGWDEGI